jgi:hypothetical protein
VAKTQKEFLITAQFGEIKAVRHKVGYRACFVNVIIKILAHEREHFDFIEPSFHTNSIFYSFERSHQFALMQSSNEKVGNVMRGRESENKKMKNKNFHYENYFFQA